MPDLFPVFLSLRVATIATLLTLAVGVPFAWLLARRSFPGRDLVSALIFSRDGRMLVSTGGPVTRIWHAGGQDAASGR